MKILDSEFKPLKVGDKVEYIGDYEDDNDLYEYLEDNNVFTLTINHIEAESELCWADGVDFAVPTGLVKKLS